MTQHDGNIADQLAPAFRTDLNAALVALLTNSSGATAPSSTYAHMLWVDTTTDMVKIRSAADDAWISLFSLDESGNLATPAGLSIASQAEAEAGTENTKTMTALRVAQAIAALASGDAVLLDSTAVGSVSSYTSSGLDLSGYRKALIWFDSFSSTFSSINHLTVAGVSIVGNTGYQAGFNWDMVCEIDLNTGRATSFSAQEDSVTSLVGPTLTYLGITTATTSITLGSNSGVWDAGIFKLWGVK